MVILSKESLPVSGEYNWEFVKWVRANRKLRIVCLRSDLVHKTSLKSQRVGPWRHGKLRHDWLRHNRWRHEWRHTRCVEKSSIQNHQAPANFRIWLYSRIGYKISSWIESHTFGEFPIILIWLVPIHYLHILYFGEFVQIFFFFGFPTASVNLFFHASPFKLRWTEYELVVSNYIIQFGFDLNRKKWECWDSQGPEIDTSTHK